jgi:Na+-translocating ferredoxin:NAD+ oxidoreductase RnfD subunit
LVIWCLGGVILYQLGRLHIPLAFLGAFLPLVFVRSWWTGDPWLAEFAPITSPMFQLYIFFMITDPKTTTKGKWSQCLVVVLVALVETIYRLAFRDIHSLYHALFTVGPLTNLIEIGYQRWKNREKAQVEARETKGELVGVS